MAIELVCKHCGESFREVIMFALMADLGAVLSWDPRECNSGDHIGEKHVWVSKECEGDE